MKRLYLDWGVISNLKKKEYAVLQNFFLSHKDRLFYVYSPAHIDDLKRSEGDSRLTEDLKTLTNLVGDHLLTFNKKDVTAYRATPSLYYDLHKNDPPIRLAEFGNVLSSLDSSIPDRLRIGSRIKELLQAISFPVPKVILSNTYWDTLLPELPAKPSILDVIQSAGLFVDRMQDEEKYYKNYRSDIHDKGFKLDVNAGNWTDKEAIPNISVFLESKGIKKSFMELVKMPFSERKSISDYEVFVAAYTMLDLLGYHSDKLSKPGSTINGLLSDAQHAFMASYCDYFITEDRRLAAKAKALYIEFGIETIVLAPSDVETVLQEDLKSYDSKYFFSFLHQEINRLDAKVERHMKENDQDSFYDIYYFTHRLLGIFPRGFLYEQSIERKDHILLLDMGKGRSTSFLFFDEVAMIVDLLFTYLSAEPIHDYESIKEALVRGDTSISVIWTIRGGRIVLKNNEASHKPELIVVIGVDNAFTSSTKSD